MAKLLSRLSDGGSRVVVVDAGTGLGERVRGRLREAGVEAEPAPADGVDRAAAVVAPHDPPDADAVALIDRVDDSPVVVAGATGDPGMEARALAAGAADYVPATGGRLDVLVQRVARVADVEVEVDPDAVGGDDGSDDEAFPAYVTRTVAALNEATGEFNAAGSWQAVAQRAAEAANEVLEFPGTSVRIYNEDDDSLESVSLPATVSDIEERPPYPVDDSPHGKAFRRGETVVEDIGDDDQFDRDPFSQTMYVPIGEYGVLSVGIETGEFSRVDMLFAESLAESARNAFQQTERERQLAATAARAGEVAERLVEAGTEVTDAAEAMRAASDEVIESVDEIADGAAEQSDQLQAVLGEMDDLLASVEETTATADEVARQSRETARLARQGGERADAGMSEMRHIEDRTEAMVEDIRDLDEEMQRISEIVELIDDVAEQTNILALNASIEAARAGEAGEGFAVVADEVKDLAEETRQSTEEIAAIIEAVTDRTNRTLDEMEEIQADVSDSVGTVEDALGALERIGEQVGETNESIQQVSRVVEDQSDTVQETVSRAKRVASISEEVSAQTGSVAELVRDQAAALEQVTGNAQELESMAAGLQSLTEEFSVDDAVAEDVASGGGASGGSVGADDD